MPVVMQEDSDARTVHSLPNKVQCHIKDLLVARLVDGCDIKKVDTAGIRWVLVEDEDASRFTFKVAQLQEVRIVTIHSLFD